VDAASGGERRADQANLAAVNALVAEDPSATSAVPLVGAREAAYRSAVMEALYTAAADRSWVALP